ncbi:MAG TPA: hypothetical protein VMZ53_30385 [Kofleriaceae bacterium]|nr:hypothetical protein [Kofleriaceae bacterium]
MKLAIVIVLALTSSAAARVVMTPTVPRTCGTAESWDKVMKCLERFGTPKLERSVDGAKLVGIAYPKFNVPGLYLYRSVGKRWVIAGMFEAIGTFDVRGFSRPTIAKHTGYRFDVGVVQSETSDETSSANEVRRKVSVFCDGGTYRCTEVTTSCERLLDGRATETFRGKLAIKGDIAKVTGDRSRAGTMCDVPDELQLDFAQVNRIPAMPIGDPLF